VARGIIACAMPDRSPLVPPPDVADTAMPRQSTFCKDDAAGSAHEDTKEAKKQRR